MRKIFYVLFSLLVPISLYANVGYDIAIDDNGYLLKIEMDFNQGQTLLSVREALKNGTVLGLLSPKVVSVTNTAIEGDKYYSLMITKSFGISSKLLSMCEDKMTVNEWKRSCSLQTNKLDGGKYMEWKGDDVSCIQKDPKEVHCSFLIKGKALPLKVLGIQILSSKLFSVKTKYEAMNNFFKLYYFIKNYNLSPKLALYSFDHSKIKDETNQFEQIATKELKTAPLFKRSFFLQD